MLTLVEMSIEVLGLRTNDQTAIAAMVFRRAIVALACLRRDDVLLESTPTQALNGWTQTSAGLVTMQDPYELTRMVL